MTVYQTKVTYGKFGGTVLCLSAFSRKSSGFVFVMLLTLLPHSKNSKPMKRACLLDRSVCPHWRHWLWLGLIALPVVVWSTPAVAIAPMTVELAQASTRPTLRLGSTGSAVSEIQAMLVLLGYFDAPIDGQYQAPTEEAVKAFQVDAGLSDDGIVGPATWEKLLPSPSTEFTPPAVPETVASEDSEDEMAEEETAEAADPPVELPVLRQGMTGSAVSRVQETLKARGFYDGAIDGIFGPGTEAAVMEFQTDARLAADGIVGPATWQALLQ